MCDCDHRTGIVFQPCINSTDYTSEMDNIFWLGPVHSATCSDVADWVFTSLSAKTTFVHQSNAFFLFGVSSTFDSSYILDRLNLDKFVHGGFEVS